MITYQEFAIFSRAWLSRDPNDPSLPADPNLIDPNDLPAGIRSVIWSVQETVSTESI
jgi:hypothetical protein